MRGIHVLAVGLVVPPDVAQVGGNHIRAGVNVADDALAGWNRARKLVFDRVTGFELVNGRIDLRTESLISVHGIWPGVHGRSIVRVDHVARRAATMAIVARM